MIFGLIDDQLHVNLRLLEGKNIPLRIIEVLFGCQLGEKVDGTKYVSCIMEDLAHIAGGYCTGI